MTVNDTSLYGSVPFKVQNEHRHVETQLLNIPVVHSKHGRDRALQQQVCSAPALSGRRALLAGDTQPVGHALQQRPPGPVLSGECAQSAPLTQPRTSSQPIPEYKLANSPVNIANLKLELDKYDTVNRAHAVELRQGFSEGFKLGYSGPRELKLSKNLISAKENSEEVLSKIKGEIEKGRVGGPFEVTPFTNMRCSPIGLVPKKAPGEFRLIHHLSWPEGNSVNFHIDPEKASVKYTSFDDAIRVVQQSGQHCELAKCDIKSAFRLLPVHPSDYELLGFSFQDKYYFDKAMPFGCSVSCATWEKFSTFIEWVLTMKANRGMSIHYLDDYLFAGSQGSGDCKALLEIFHEICQHLGVPIAHEKTEGPVTKLVFLGLQIDTVEQTVTIPMDKLVEIVDKIKCMLSHKKTTLKQLQSMIGSLNFACRAVAPGRAFLRRLIGATIPLKAPHHVTRVNQHIAGDLNMWLEFLENYNGVSVFRDQTWLTNEDMEFYTDSAASIGMGIYLNGKWAQARWGTHFPQETSGNNITFLEYFPILVALHIFEDEVRNKKVLFHCDNAAVVEIINNQTCKCPRVMDLVRPLVLQCMRLNTIIKAKHIPGVKNTIADAISRFNTQIFRLNAPEAEKLPTDIPHFLWQL